MTGKHLLIVDDDEHIRMLYQEEFKEEGYQIDIAADGPTALEMIKARKPDAVIMDIRMPGMDGLEAMARIVADFNTIPIIINSAYTHYRNDFSSWLADAYVIKSFDLTELKAKVREVLGDVISS